MKLTPAVIEIVASDMAASVGFYRRLGLEFPEGAETSPHAEAECGGLRLALDAEDTVRSMEPDWEWPTGGHRMALAFACDSPAEVDAAYAELTAGGVAGAREPWDAFWGMRYAVLHDPDGNPIDLFAPLPG